MSIESVISQHADYLMGLDSAITGVAQGMDPQSGQPTVKVLVSERHPDLDRKLPAQVGGYAVEIEVTGTFRAK
jgi:hypothetical protein